jgi:hypothetical protein
MESDLPLRHFNILFSPRQRQAWRRRLRALSRSQLEELAGEALSMAAKITPNLELHRTVPRLPHGPYWYVYRKSKRKRTVSVRFEGVPAFPRASSTRCRRTFPYPLYSRSRSGRIQTDGI